jgi:hypothetical protein
MLSLLIVALLADPPPLSRADLAFSRAVEDSIRALPPEAVQAIILDLGSECYFSRESAERKLLRYAQAEGGGFDEAQPWRWLWWGLRQRDLEIRLRCLSVLRRITPCPVCGGNPYCREFRAAPGQDWKCRVCGRSEWMHEEYAPCEACQGVGSVWDGTIWD